MQCYSCKQDGTRATVISVVQALFALLNWGGRQNRFNDWMEREFCHPSWGGLAAGAGCLLRSLWDFGVGKLITVPVVSNRGRDLECCADRLSRMCSARIKAFQVDFEPLRMYRSGLHSSGGCFATGICVG